MDQTPTSIRHRRRRRSAAGRVFRALGLGTRWGGIRLVVLGAAVLVAAAAFSVAMSAGARTPAAGPAAAMPSASPGGTSAGGAPSPRATATVPVVPAGTPSVTPSTPPAGTVAARVRIERLGIDLPIVEGDGIDAPMHKAAHYPGSGWPGGGTNIYLYAHAQAGMFLALWDARVGDRVVLDLADGTEARYVVTDVRPKVPWNAVRVTEPTPDERLSLQTSTSYTPTAPRFLVIAEPAP